MENWNPEGGTFGGHNNSEILQNWFSPEIKSPHFKLLKFQNSIKNTPELCVTHLNLMNDKMFGSIDKTLGKTHLNHEKCIEI